jgi:hypothetical protein
MTISTPRSRWIPVLGAAFILTALSTVATPLFAATSTPAEAATADPRRITTLEEDHVLAMISVALLDEIQSEVMQAIALDGAARRNPLVNLARAESRQAENLLTLLKVRGLEAPVVPFTSTAVGSNAETLADACALAADAERRNIWLYADFLAHDLPADVRRVFQQNLRVSLENHLPALERCSTR